MAGVIAAGVNAAGIIAAGSIIAAGVVVAGVIVGGAVEAGVVAIAPEPSFLQTSPVPSPVGPPNKERILILRKGLRFL